ncbi:MAG: ABC transporter substrate-binding protein [Betaproteobacteria bacterium]|nr:ABC transporter substrate-binding protein [Betaproteobacteria bacterium]
MKQKYAKLWGAVALGAGLWAAGSSGALAQSELLLGFLTSDSGPFVTLARTNELAARIALDEINSAGGVNGKKLRYISFDTAGNPGQTVVGLRKLAEDDKVLAVIGPLSSGQVTVASAAGDRIGIVTMSMSSSAPKLVANSKYAMRNTSDEAYLFERLMQSLKAKGIASATGAIAYANDDTISRTLGEKVLPALMKKAGVDVKLSVDFKFAAFDLSAQVAQLKANPTDLIGIGAPQEAAVKLVQELRRQGHKGRMVGGTTINDPELPARMGKDGDGTVITSTFFADLNDRTKRFSAEFEKRAKAAKMERTQASQFDAATYDIVQYYAWAMKESKVTGEPKRLAEERTAIRQALGRMKNFPALEGAISFGPDNDALKPAYIIEARNGKWTLLDTHPAPR